MKLIQHRVNTTEQLKLVSHEYGIEVDLRATGTDIILHHDPFVEGERFEDFLGHYAHAYIILNTKEEGMEVRLIQLMQQFGIENYFFLDLSLPFLVKTVKQGCNRIAIRFSKYEPLAFVAKFQGLVQWVWVDCFSANILSPDAYQYLKAHFKICIVSPELQGHPTAWINNFKEAFRGFEIDAVCTKKPELWK